MERTFVLNGYEVNKKTGEIEFNYSIKSQQDSLGFTEKLIFPNADFSEVPQELLTRLLQNLSLILGISYWKLYCPNKIEVKENFLTKEQAEFWKKVYTKGLGEFFYKNNIDFRGLVRFPYNSNDTYHHSDKALTLQLKDRSLLMLGGGKDSIVAAELLKEHKKSFTAFVVNEHPIQKEIIKLLVVDAIVVKREIDPKLLELNKQQGSYNGHVPVSAIHTFIALLAAVVYNFRYVISSNERSSNYGNVEYLGETINHQWSKSFEFEEMFQEYVKKYITPGINYFSLLRPLHEIKIAQLFSKYPTYFSVFSSCNKNFRIKGFTSEESSKNTSEVADRTPRMVGRWCRQCPKCAFVFATLAAFLPKGEVIKIFNKNLFSDASLVDAYKELLGIKNIKPFECVGTPDETKLAFYLIYKKGEFNNGAAMQMFEKQVVSNMKNVERLESKLLSISDEHRIPSEFVNISISLWDSKN